jgi:hypothetical protein
LGVLAGEEISSGWKRSARQWSPSAARAPRAAIRRPCCRSRAPVGRAPCLLLDRVAADSARRDCPRHSCELVPDPGSRWSSCSSSQDPLRNRVSKAHRHHGFGGRLGGVSSMLTKSPVLGQEAFPLCAEQVPYIAVTAVDPAKPALSPDGFVQI